MRARMSPVEAMPWPFSPPMPTAKSILVSCAIWFKTVLVCWQSGLKQAQAEIPPLLGFGAASKGQRSRLRQGLRRGKQRSEVRNQKEIFTELRYFADSPFPN